MTWHRTSRHARGYGAAWDKLRLTILQRDDYLCVLCAARGRVREAQSVDHIQPKAKGGTDDPANLRSLCRPCHDEVSLEQRGSKPRPKFGADGFPTT